MKSKLTLSLPEKTISEAKQIAKRRHTTVSALFAESLQYWKFDASPCCLTTSDHEENEMADLLGAFTPQAPFDTRSAHIREKHG
ncbi:MAG: hypothetical protein JJU29_08715 [Verrucomicrobia bacterium]|nr:hypothetical protein [Verrucomicrobiota bacterium]MCH8511246.1 DUF6364 family protein [Kiritimatiellia bacterium]